MRLPEFDVIVIGAGPAGVSAALAVVKGGARVALVAQSEFPRAKPCAGVLSSGTVRLLKYDASSVFREEVDNMKLTYQFKNEVTVKSKTPVAVMTKRSEFDLLGFNLAINSGCNMFYKNMPYRLHQEKRSVLLEYPDLRLRARYVIAADGASSLARRVIFKHKKRGYGVSIEADIDMADVRFHADHSVRADFGIVRGGAAWAFPKRDHFNVGLYTYSSSLSSSINRRKLQEYAMNVLGTDRLMEVRGFPIANDCSSYSMSSGRVLFIGDAGGFAYTHNGEGIYGAVLTGNLAAAAVLADKDVARDYQDSASRYLRRCAINRMVSGPLYSSLGFSYRLFAWHLSRQFAAGDQLPMAK